MEDLQREAQLGSLEDLQDCKQQEGERNAKHEVMWNTLWL